VLGVVWLVFTVTLYWFAGIGPIVTNLRNQSSALSYLNSSGVTFVGFVLVVGVLWYVIKAIRNRAAGVETKLMYQMLPPD